jgi:FSR family fosmidomycin resistance protein-like MFS transporter
MSDEVEAVEAPPSAVRGASETVFGVIVAIGVCHGLNDMMQSLLPAIYPEFKANFGLTFGQIGLVTLCYQITASILQPLIGFYADKRPTPMALPGGALFSLAGLAILSFAHSYGVILLGACILGVGSAVFHPEASRVARMAAGPRPGLAQAMFQVGGNFGSALGPLAAAIFVVRYGQPSLRVFALLALISVTILWNVGVWYRHHGLERLKAGAKARGAHPPLPRGKAACGLLILMALIFSKFVYLASISSYFTFYLINRFGASVQTAQLHLFMFLAAVAVGTILGGPLGDRLGRKTVIWFSILGALPFTLLLPHVDLFWTGPLAIVIGLILASAFPAIVVFAQELAPGNVGMVAGLCFGLSFGLGGIGAAVLGRVADLKGIAYVYQVCAFLPALGLLAAFLPMLPKHEKIRA